MMEKVVLAPQRPRKTINEEIAEECKDSGRLAVKVTARSAHHHFARAQSEVMEKINQRLQAKYKALEENEVRYEAINCDDADYVIVAFGSSARIRSATVGTARAEGLEMVCSVRSRFILSRARWIADLANAV